MKGIAEEGQITAGRNGRGSSLSPRCHEVFNKLLVGIAAGVNFRTARRTELEPKTRSARLAVYSLRQFRGHGLRTALSIRRSLPLVTHIQQVHEEVIAQYANASVKTPFLLPSKLAPSTRIPPPAQSFPARSASVAVLYQST